MTGKALSVGPAGRGSWISAVCILGLLTLSLPPTPTPCQLAGSFALLVGSDLRAGYGKGVVEEGSSFLWQEPRLLRGQVAAVY